MKNNYILKSLILFLFLSIPILGGVSPTENINSNLISTPSYPIKVERFNPDGKSRELDINLVSKNVLITKKKTVITEINPTQNSINTTVNINTSPNIKPSVNITPSMSISMNTSITVSSNIITTTINITTPSIINEKKVTIIKPKLKLESSNFSHKNKIPIKFTCNGQNISPSLSWKNSPKETLSYALTMENYNAPKGRWFHWVIWNIPAHEEELKENIGFDENPVFEQGLSDFNKNHYEGPCLKDQTYVYHFTLYALDQFLTLSPTSNSHILKTNLDKHVLDKAMLIGTF